MFPVIEGGCMEEKLHRGIILRHALVFWWEHFAPVFNVALSETMGNFFVAGGQNFCKI